MRFYRDLWDRIPLNLVGFFRTQYRLSVDIHGFISYIRALQAEGQAFVGPSLSQISLRSIEEDAACRFSFAITMSTKPSRR